MRALLRMVVLGLIGGYRRYLSPYKGFRCAHAACHGRGSCSDWVARIVRERQAHLWLPLAWRRFRACARAFLALREQAPPARQKGACCVIPCVIPIPGGRR
jgi:putative component of membrane protein insertase Oxa1/YidC/SpoIIIJ protein YidD